MKNLQTAIIYAILLLLLGCNSSSPKSRFSQRSVEDSLIKLRRDSIAKVKAEELAYLNRPWKTGNFVDNFGDPTGENFIYTEVDGRFSNSATSNSYLFVEIIIKKNAAGILLHQYQKSNPAEKFIGSSEIQMKNEAGQIISIRSYKEWNQKGGILIENWPEISRYSFSQFRDFIKKSVGKIKVVVIDEYSSVFNFTIDATGFTNEFTKL